MGYGNWSGCIKWFYDITEIAITAKVMLPNQGFLVVNEKSSLGKLYCRHHDLDNRYAVSVVTNDHGHVPFVVITNRSFPHSWLIIWCVKWATRRMSLVEQELRTLLAHLGAPGFNGIRVGRFLVFCVMYCRSLFVLLSFFFWSLYCLFFSYLPLWYLPAFLIEPKLKPNPSIASS